MRTPEKYEHVVFEAMKSNRQTFRDGVLLCQAEFTIDMQCIILNLTMMDSWDLANIQLDMTSGAFKQRLIVWLEDIGLHMTAGEERGVTAEITAIQEEDGASGCKCLCIFG